MPVRPELGRGWAFPIRFDRRGRFAMSEGQRDVQEAIGIVLGTGLGERVMRGEFGSEVPAILFEPASDATATRLENAITEALIKWEPRIDVLGVEVSRDTDVETRFLASVTYRLRENNSVFNQVYPFYLTEGAES